MFFLKSLRFARDNNYNQRNNMLKLRYNQRKQHQQLYGGATNYSDRQLDRDAQTSNSSVFLSRIMTHVGTFNVKKYLESIGIEVINIEKVSHSFSKFNSFKVCVKSSDYHRVSNENIWSILGAKCRPWEESKYKNFNNHAMWDRVALSSNNYGL